MSVHCLTPPGGYCETPFTLHIAAGLPPTWARKKDAVHILQRVLEEQYGQDYRPEQLRLWRRKLLFHQSGNRSHAFYGSFSKPR